ncbi:valine--tRNA ligase [Ferroglobus sp.]|uniref:valine--tRNA ligase n=1 Tax=Ferroglobus sp. TaxID=2614230 RepID=UPI0025B86452|nr:valine--tRNA ligase [Ferroglobus sp.]
MEKEYRAREVEDKWLRLWKDDMYYFDWNSKKPHFIIDTPPPYPTGSFHIGNALNWCYIDFIARYKRMKGYEVMFPQGWDCHGLPTEVKVEELHGIRKNDVPREKFRELCVEFTEKNIKKMKETMKKLGLSIDWSKEYITMYPEYYRKTQVSFVRLYEKGLIYKGYHPVIICPRCETTIALAEIEYKEGRTKLNYIKFDENVIIATTRPELIPACVAVAVHPEDERYKDLVGETVVVPISGQEVKIIADEEVDPNYGTGMVMICTFGDKQDVRWWKKHGLELRQVLTRDGKLNEKAGKYAGLTVSEAREKIIEDFRKEGRLIKVEEVNHKVGVCWRCKTPVEIIPEEQWFVKVDKERVLEAARKIKWIPEHMYLRLEDWVESMEWDWVISRQRVFATPIPVWYCENCGETIVAKEEWLPVDPTRDQPKEPCPKCGSTKFRGEDDVLDTWMDSSITPLAIVGWPEELKEYPTHLRPQGHDIIRTWAFYTILRSIYLVDQIPWYEIVINGMVLGEDGRKMSKSLGNYVEAEEVIERYGADCLRQWAAIGGVVGSDVAFSWKEIKSASRFQQKFWSLTRFAAMHLENYELKEEHERYLRDADRWILSKLNKLIKEVDRAMENYNFSEALKLIRGFTWYDLADNYVELVKNRLYSGEENEKLAAKYTLYKTMSALIRLLAPFTPFLSEECWNALFKTGSVHKQSYPEVEEKFIDEEAERRGEKIRRIVEEIRRYKHDRKMALNAPMKRILIYSPERFDVRDISGAVNADVSFIEEMPKIETKVREVKPKYSIIGPKFKEKAKIVVEAVTNLSEEEKLKFMETGKVEVEVDGERIELSSDWFEFKLEKVVGDLSVDVLEVENVIVMIERV